MDNQPTNNSDDDDQNDENMSEEKRERLRGILNYLFGNSDEKPEGVEMIELGTERRRLEWEAEQKQEEGDSVAQRAIDAFAALEEAKTRKAKADATPAAEATPENIEDLVKGSIQTVTIKTEAFSSEAYGFYALPGIRVMNVLAMDEMRKMPEMVKLLKSAIIEPKKSDYLDVLSFGELGEVLSQWIEISQPDYERTLMRGFRK